MPAGEDHWGELTRCIGGERRGDPERVSPLFRLGAFPFADWIPQQSARRCPMTSARRSRTPDHSAIQLLRTAWAGGTRDALIAGYRPATAPIASAAAKLPASPSSGMAMVRSLVAA